MSWNRPYKWEIVKREHTSYARFSLGINNKILLTILHKDEKTFNLKNMFKVKLNIIKKKKNLYLKDLKIYFLREGAFFMHFSLLSNNVYFM